MADKIQIKRSSEEGKKPTPEQLADGELALNLKDKKIYAKDSDGVVQEFPSVEAVDVGVQKVNELTGEITIKGSDNIDVDTSGQNITLNTTSNVALKADVPAQVNLIEGTGINITGTYPDKTITNKITDLGDLDSVVIDGQSGIAENSVLTFTDGNWTPGTGGGSSDVENLPDLGDVTISPNPPTQGQVLQYTDGKWKNVDVDAAEGRTTVNGLGGAVTLKPSGSVSITQPNPNDNNEIVISATSGVPEANSDGKTYGRQNATWVEIEATGGSETLSGLTDTTISNPAEDQFLRWSGDTASGKWVNEAVTLSSAPDDAQKNVQSDWNEATPASDAFIKNKPELAPKDAEKNVQSDWNEVESTKAEFINNKPTKLSDFQDDLGYTDTDTGIVKLTHGNESVTGGTAREVTFKSSDASVQFALNANNEIDFTVPLAGLNIKGVVQYALPQTQADGKITVNGTEYEVLWDPATYLDDAQSGVVGAALGDLWIVQYQGNANDEGTVVDGNGYVYSLDESGNPEWSLVGPIQGPPGNDGSSFLPISSTDDTVTLDGASSVFTISTGGSEKVVIDNLGRMKLLGNAVVSDADFKTYIQFNLDPASAGEAYKDKNLMLRAGQSFMVVNSDATVRLVNDAKLKGAADDTAEVAFPSSGDFTVSTGGETAIHANQYQTVGIGTTASRSTLLLAKGTPNRDQSTGVLSDLTATISKDTAFGYFQQFTVDAADAVIGEYKSYFAKGLYGAGKVTDYIGYQCEPIATGADNVTAFRSRVNASATGGTNYAFYAEGSAISHFNGALEVPRIIGSAAPASDASIELGANLTVFTGGSERVKVSDSSFLLRTDDINLIRANATFAPNSGNNINNKQMLMLKNTSKDGGRFAGLSFVHVFDSGTAGASGSIGMRDDDDGYNGTMLFTVKGETGSQTRDFLEATKDHAKFNVDIQASRIVGATDPDSDASIALGADLTVSTGGAEHLRVDNNGRLLVGDNAGENPNFTFHFRTPNTNQFVLESDTGIPQIKLKANDFWYYFSLNPTDDIFRLVSYDGNTNASSNVFSAKPDGKLLVNTGVQTPTVKGIVDTDASIDLGANIVVNGKIKGTGNYSSVIELAAGYTINVTNSRFYNRYAASSEITHSEIIYNTDNGLVLATTIFGKDYSSGLPVGIPDGQETVLVNCPIQYVMEAKRVLFCSNQNNAEPDVVIDCTTNTDDPVLKVVPKGHIETSRIVGSTAPSTDAQINLGTELLTTNHTPTQPNSIATKQTVDDKIQVMTTAEYNALGANVNPTTLYCLTD